MNPINPNGLGFIAYYNVDVLDPTLTEDSHLPFEQRLSVVLEHSLGYIIGELTELSPPARRQYDGFGRLGWGQVEFLRLLELIGPLQPEDFTDRGNMLFHTSQ